jgi:hypothetical protein
MTEEIFCYHCRRHHPRAEVQLIETRTGKRWRCIKSVIASQAGRGQRDAFGHAVTAANQNRYAKGKLQALPHGLREVPLNSAPTPGDEPAALDFGL